MKTDFVTTDTSNPTSDKATKMRETVNQFLLFVLPDETRKCYEVLAGLSYPISDYEALAKQVNSCGCGKESQGTKAGAEQVVLSRLKPADFPLLGAQGALEKFHATLEFPQLSRFKRKLLIPDPILERGNPRVMRTNMEMFGPVCAQRAYDTYARLIEDGFNQAVAFQAGMTAGRQCVS